MKSDALRQALLAVDPAALSDADKSLRVVDPALRALRPGLRLLGPARTVRCHEDFLAVLLALRDAEAGEVLVIDTEGSRCAVAGELFASEAMRKGLAGIVIDGGCRDTPHLRNLDLPIYARFSNPRSGTTVNPGDTQIPVQCGGVRVAPGDWVFGDDDGILVASPDELESALPRAREIQATEAELRSRIEAGEALASLTNVDEHASLRARGKKSALAFRLPR